MDISLRLRGIAKHVDNSICIADIGTDHGYIPIYLIKQGKCKKAIASDINSGPVEKAKFNVSMMGLEENIECRLGGGLSIIKPKEVDTIVIAGMGGNLIKNIIEEGLEVFKNAEYAVLQPIQNPEILRKYLLEKGFYIMDEDLCLDDKKYYEIIKVKYDSKPIIKEDIFYEISEILMEKHHPFIEEYLKFKIAKSTKAHDAIADETIAASKKKQQLTSKILRLKELLECL